MKTIAIVAKKGGTSKSNLAKCLAVSFSQDFLTLGIDLDPQLTFAKWSDRRENDEPAVADKLFGRLPKTLEGAKSQGVEVCIIDTAGRAEGAAHAAIKAADLVLVPLQPTADDLETAKESDDMIKAAGNPESVVVLTRVRASGTAVEQARRFLEKVDMVTCPHVIGERVAYQQASAAGLAVQEFEPDGKAAQEIQHVYMFTRKQLGL